MRKTAILAVSAIGIIVLSGCAWFLTFIIRAQAPVRLAENKARNSAEVRLAIGHSLKTERFIKGYLVSKDGNGNADLTIPIYGPLGHGTLFEWAQEEKGKWHLCSLVFRSHDESTTVLVSDTLTHCERE